MKTIIKLAFFAWLAIAAGMTWLTSDYVLAGQISNALLSMLAFFGGITGVWLTIYNAMREDTAA